MSTKYKWDYTPQAHQKSKAFNPYKIKDDVINALKSNRDVEQQSYQTRLNEGLSNIELEGKESEINLRAVHNVQKLNDDRDLRELQMMTKAGQELVTFGLQKWREGEIKQAEDSWFSPENQKARETLISRYDKLEQLQAQNRGNFEAALKQLKEEDPDFSAAHEQLFRGLSGPGLGVRQRQWVTSALPGLSNRLVRKIGGYEWTDPTTVGVDKDYPDGKTYTYDTLEVGNPAHDAQRAIMEHRAVSEIRNSLTFISGQRIASTAVIDKHITPALNKVLASLHLDNANKLKTSVENNLKEEFNLAVTELLNIAAATPDLTNAAFRNFMEVQTARHGKGVALDMLGEALKTKAESGTYLEGAKKVEALLDTETYEWKKVVDKDGKVTYEKGKPLGTMRERLGSRFDALGLGASITAKYNSYLRNKEAQQDAYISKAILSANAELLKHGNGISDDARDGQITKVYQQMQQEIPGVDSARLYKLVNNGIVTSKGQSAEEEFNRILQIPGINDNPVSSQYLRDNGYSEAGIAKAVEAGLALQEDWGFTNNEILDQPKQVLKGVEENLGTALTGIDIDEAITIGNIRDELNRLTVENIDLGKYKSNKDARKAAIAQVTADLKKIDPKSGAPTSPLWHKNHQPNVAMQLVANDTRRVVNTRMGKGDGQTFAEAIALPIKEAQPLIKKYMGLIGQKNLSLEQLQGIIRDDAALRVIGAGHKMRNWQVLDQMLQAETGVRLPKSMQQMSQTKAALNQRVNDGKFHSSQGDNNTNNQIVMSVENQEKLNNEFGSSDLMSDPNAFALYGNKFDKVYQNAFSSALNTDILVDDNMTDLLRANGFGQSPYGLREGGKFSDFYNPNELHQGLQLALLTSGADLSQIRKSHEYKGIIRFNPMSGRDWSGSTNKMIAIDVHKDSPLIQEIRERGDLLQLRMEIIPKSANSKIDSNYYRVTYTGNTNRPDMTLQGLSMNPQFEITSETRVDSSTIRAANYHLFATQGPTMFKYNKSGEIAANLAEENTLTFFELPKERQNQLLQLYKQVKYTRNRLSMQELGSKLQNRFFYDPGRYRFDRQPWEGS